MPVSNIKALHIVRPKEAGKLILKSFKSNDGNARRVADELDCSYHTLWRLIEGDQDLKNKVAALRDELANQGVSQRGYTPND